MLKHQEVARPCDRGGLCDRSLQTSSANTSGAWFPVPPRDTRPRLEGGALLPALPRLIHPNAASGVDRTVDSYLRSLVKTSFLIGSLHRDLIQSFNLYVYVINFIV